MVIVVLGKFVWSATIIELCYLPVHTVCPDKVGLFLRISDTAQKVFTSVMFVTDHKTYFFI
jgi:hypothetical protein